MGVLSECTNLKTLIEFTVNLGTEGRSLEENEKRTLIHLINEILKGKGLGAIALFGSCALVTLMGNLVRCEKSLILSVRRSYALPFSPDLKCGISRTTLTNPSLGLYFKVHFSGKASGQRIVSSIQKQTCFETFTARGTRVKTLGL